MASILCVSHPNALLGFTSFPDDAVWPHERSPARAASGATGAVVIAVCLRCCYTALPWPEHAPPPRSCPDRAETIGSSSCASSTTALRRTALTGSGSPMTTLLVATACRCGSVKARLILRLLPATSRARERVLEAVTPTGSRPTSSRAWVENHAIRLRTLADVEHTIMACAGASRRKRPLHAWRWLRWPSGVDCRKSC